MKLRHKVDIKVEKFDGSKERVLTSCIRRLPAKLIQLLFGKFSQMLILTPGESVQSVEIKEIKGDRNGQ